MRCFDTGISINWSIDSQWSYVKCRNDQFLISTRTAFHHHNLEQQIFSIALVNQLMYSLCFRAARHSVIQSDVLSQSRNCLFRLRSQTRRLTLVYNFTKHFTLLFRCVQLLFTKHYTFICEHDSCARNVWNSTSYLLTSLSTMNGKKFKALIVSSPSEQWRTCLYLS